MEYLRLEDFKSNESRPDMSEVIAAFVNNFNRNADEFVKASHAKQDLFMSQADSPVSLWSLLK